MPLESWAIGAQYIGYAGRNIFAGAAGQNHHDDDGLTLPMMNFEKQPFSRTGRAEWKSAAI